MTTIPTPGPPTATNPGGYLHTVLLGSAALLLYVALQQHTLYSFDSQWMLLCALNGDVLHPYHYAFLPLLAVSRSILQPLGCSIHTCCVAVSAVGAAIGIVFVHRACLRTCRSRADAALATIAAAVAPALVFYATVVEVHGSHFGMCGATFLASAAFCSRPSLGRGAALGAAMGLGFAGHATGSLLPAMVVPVVIALAFENGISWRRSVPGLVLAVAVHGAIVLLLPRALSLLGIPAALSHSAGLFEEYAEQFLKRPFALPRAALLEWLWPFAPMSAVVFVAVWRRTTRHLAIAVLLASIPYVCIAAILNWRADEGGAYLLPLIWPMALIAVRALPRRGVILLAVISLAIAMTRTFVHDVQPWRSFATGYQEAIGERRALVIVGETAEMSAFFMQLTDRLPRRDWFVPMMLKVSGEGERTGEEEQQRLTIGIRVLVESGIEVWITKDGTEALAGLRTNAGDPIGAQALATLRSAFAWQESTVPGFPAWRLRPR